MPACGSSPPRGGSRTINSSTSEATKPTRAEHDEGVAPAVGGGDRGAERDAQCRADRRAQIVDAERGAAPARREIVGDDGVGRRHAARFADADRHARGDQLRIVRRQAAGHRRRAPQRAGERQHPHSVGPVREPADGNGDEAIEQREIESADQPELAVGDMQAVLDRLGEDRQQLRGRGSSAHRRSTASQARSRRARPVPSASSESNATPFPSTNSPLAHRVECRCFAHHDAVRRGSSTLTRV